MFSPFHAETEINGKNSPFIKMGMKCNHDFQWDKKINSLCRNTEWQVQNPALALVATLYILAHGNKFSSKFSHLHAKQIQLSSNDKSSIPLIISVALLPTLSSLGLLLFKFHRKLVMSWSSLSNSIEIS